MLFEDGFDVWVGHQRATYWGHDHVQLHFTDRVPIFQSSISEQVMAILILSALRALIDMTSQVFQVQFRTKFDLRCLNKS